MTIKRTHKLFQKEYLKKNNHLKILDLGCTHLNYWEEANHFADIVDYTKQFSEKNLNFTLLEVDKKLPFKDKEFDYVILSHVLEHGPNINEFTLEVERIAKAGYIELPMESVKHGIKPDGKYRPGEGGDSPIVPDIEKVATSSRLVDSAVRLVISKFEPGIQMRKILESAGQSLPESKPLFEINLKHKLIKKLQSMKGKEFSNFCKFLFDYAVIAEGGSPKDPSKYLRQLDKYLL